MGDLHLKWVFIKNIYNTYIYIYTLCDCLLPEYFTYLNFITYKMLCLTKQVHVGNGQAIT